jgi:hypothetical protein
MALALTSTYLLYLVVDSQTL